MARQRIVVLGGGMAAAYLVRELAALQRDGKHHSQLDLTVVSAEADACYNRILLSALLAGEHPESALALLEPDVINPRILSGTPVRAIDLDTKCLRMEQGPTLVYDTLVIATGAGVALPSLAGLDSEGIHAFRTLEDARTLRECAGNGAHAVVVGGGLLGLEAAHGLNELGCKTTVLHRQSHLMNRQLDAEGGLQLQQLLAARGIQFRLDASIAQLQTSDRKLRAVTLADGTEMSCELLVFATGITPNRQLATNAGIDTDRGILVDAYMHTSAADVYALGECCQVGSECFGLVAPVREQARVLAGTLTGRYHHRFQSEAYATQLKISGIDIFSAGDLEGEAEELLLRDPQAGVYRRLRIRNRQLVAAVLVGDKRGATWYRELIRTGCDIQRLRAGLMFGREISDALTTTVAKAA